MNDRCNEPDSETQCQNTRQRYLFFEADQSDKKKEDAGQNTPKRSFCEGLHDFRIALVFHIDPHQNQCPR